ncbi:unnamed protein product [Zymoseptoria tritici ST99CH_1A5]|uniref:Uncharacterized protein n=1 Tax=Zymoseptoria tritici ST99CH_1A5 TaxID=1276529 RepID=A0A1Y6LZ94_ZYMTR|nr:unnamed protein product [Zymoseptoria tritici ST99CH_1A5]
MEGEPLKILEDLIGRTRGAYFEGDVCAVLSSSPFIVRAFEFALADLAIDCTAQYSNRDGDGDSYAERFWDVDNRQFNPEEASELATVDVKSTLIDDPFFAKVGQRRRVCAFICINASDPNYVDFVPNFFQEADSVGTDMCFDDGEELYTIVTQWKASRLPASAYGMLSPCTSPYRMPLWLLPEAIRRARAHIRGEAVYQNPWTLVSFPDWKPCTVRQTNDLKPTGKGHASACKIALDIYQAATYHSKADGTLHLDFVGLQPRLADFKLRLDDGPQRFIQHKQEGRIRGKMSLLTDVPIRRGSGKDMYWYFSPTDRFDFLFFQFEFSQLPNPVIRTEFFFLPERLIPDSWYTNNNGQANFEIDELKTHRFHKDEDGDWVSQIKEVMRQEQQPRRAGTRPSRPAAEGREAALGLADDVANPLRLTRSLATPRAHGRNLYGDVMRSKQRAFFYNFMHECAERRSGLLVCLPKTSPPGDFGLALYRWSRSEQDMWRRYHRPPQFLHTLPPGLEMVLLTYSTRHRECSYEGPSVTAAEFCRINASADNRLLIWDLGGADTTLLTMVPSSDIQPTEAQRKVLRSNLGLRSNEWRTNTPSLSSMLRTGLQASQYAIGTDVFSSKCSWGDVWRGLYEFAAADQAVEHPAGHFRTAAAYRHTITHVLTAIMQEHYLRSQTPWIATEELDDDESEG